MAVRLGMDCKLYINDGTVETPDWTEITNARDVTLNLEKAEADVTTRGNNGWRAMVGTLKDGSIEFEMVWDTEDPVFATLLQAFLENSTVDIAAMDGDILTQDCQGLRGDMVVINFSRSEPLEEAATASVTVRPTYSTNNQVDWMVIEYGA